MSSVIGNFCCARALTSLTGPSSDCARTVVPVGRARHTHGAGGEPEVRQRTSGRGDLPPGQNGLQMAAQGSVRLTIRDEMMQRRAGLKWTTAHIAQKTHPRRRLIAASGKAGRRLPRPCRTSRAALCGRSRLPPRRTGGARLCGTPDPAEEGYAGLKPTCSGVSHHRPAAPDIVIKRNAA